MNRKVYTPLQPPTTPLQEGKPASEGDYTTHGLYRWKGFELMDREMAAGLIEVQVGLQGMILGLKLLGDTDADELVDCLERTVSACERYLLRKTDERRQAGCD